MISAKYCPMLIEFFGMPNTGKTTTAEYILKEVIADGINAKMIYERASICPIKDKTSPLFNYWTLFSLAKEYIEAFENKYDIIIADRGIIDAEIWVTAFSELFDDNNTLKHDLLGILHTHYFKNLTSIGFYFNASVNEVLRRELINRTDDSLGTIVNYDVLSAYKCSYSKLKTNFDNIIEIDSEKQSIKENEINILSIIRNQIQKLT
jgi:hypothetical protein